jgi:hypothetical protein
MAKYQGGMIGSLANNPDGTNYTGKANGVFSLPQQIVNKRSSLWAIGQTKPNPPTIGTATGASSGSVSVAFIPPVQNGGAPITLYTVTANTGQTATGASSPILISGLTSGVYYTFTVTATNSLGQSTASSASNSASPVTDIYISSVTLLLNGDGANGSTTFTDLSSSPKTITNTGSISVDTTTKKYGTGSISFQGVAGSKLTLPANTGFSFGTGNFTIEFWLKTTDAGAYKGTVNDIIYHADPNNFLLMLNDSPAQGKLTFWMTNARLCASATTVITGAWFHIAMVRDSTTTVKMFVNGSLDASATISASTVFGSGTGLIIGNQTGFANGRQLIGNIDDIRITKGIARYTANFTPPTASFPTS